MIHVHWSRHVKDPRDPEYVEAKVLCPNPACEGGEVYMLALDLSYTCTLCDGEAVCQPDDVAAWAAARGIALEIDESVFGPERGDEL